MTASSTLQSIPAPLDKLASRILPRGVLAQTLLWISLPSFSLLLALGMSFLFFCVHTAYLPFLALAGIGMIFRFRTIGLFLSYLALAVFAFVFYSSIPTDMLLWQMGILFSLALSFYVVLLAFEEGAALLSNLQGGVNEAHMLLSQTLDERKEAEESWKNEKQLLEKEIERWKDEAEHRKIEKQMDERRISLIQTEIDMLTSQKESLIEETFQARLVANEKLKQAEKNLQQFQEMSEQFIPLKEENVVLRSEKESLVQQVSLKQQHVLSLQEELCLQKDVLSSLEEEKVLLEKSKNALQNTCSEKENALMESKKALLSLEEKTISFCKERDAVFEELNVLKQEYAQLKNTVHTLNISLRILSEEKNEEEAKNNALSNQLAQALSEKTSQAQSTVDKEILLQLKKEKARAEGLYQQLRKQFEEKSGILTQTRKELFHTEEKLLAVDQEKLIQQMDLHDVDRELRSFQEEWTTLRRENTLLHDEINEMEELVSRLLSR